MATTPTTPTPAGGTMPVDLALALASFVIQALPYVTQEIGVLGQKGAVTQDQWTAFKTAVATLPQTDPAWAVTDPDV